MTNNEIHFDIDKMISGMKSSENPKDWERGYVESVIVQILLDDTHPQHIEVIYFLVNTMHTDFSSNNMYPTHWNSPGKTRITNPDQRENTHRVAPSKFRFG